MCATKSWELMAVVKAIRRRNEKNHLLEVIRYSVWYTVSFWTMNWNFCVLSADHKSFNSLVPDPIKLRLALPRGSQSACFLTTNPFEHPYLYLIGWVAIIYSEQQYLSLIGTVAHRNSEQSNLSLLEWSVHWNHCPFATMYQWKLRSFIWLGWYLYWVLKYQCNRLTLLQKENI